MWTKRFVRLLACFALFIASTAYSQDIRQDVIYLKNGSIIRGTIIEEVPGKSIKIETVDANVFVFSYDDIEKIAREMNPHAGSSYSERKSGDYLGILMVGIMTGEGETMLSVYNVNGVRVSREITLGLGVGFDKYPNGTMVPICADFRARFTNERVSASFAGSAGYSLGWIKGLSRSDCGGFVYQVGIGPSVTLGTSSSLNLQLAYKSQDAKEFYEYYWGETETSRVQYHFFSVMLGIEF